MKNALLVAAVLSAANLAAAADSPYRVRNGRAVTGGVNGSGGTAGGVAAGTAKSGMSPGASAGVAGAPVHSETGGKAFVGGAQRAAGGHRSFYGGARRIGPGAYRVPRRAAEGESAPEEAPPHFSKPGALIRTEGQKHQLSEPSAPARQHTVDAGEITLDSRKAHDSNRSHGLRVGPRDTPPPCTPGSNGCGATGGNSITPNTITTVVNEGDVRNNGAHDNQNGGGTGFDPSF